MAWQQSRWKLCGLVLGIGLLFMGRDWSWGWQPAAAMPTRLCVIDATGKPLRVLQAEAGWVYGAPTWSPDGKWLAFERRRAGDPIASSHIRTVSLDGSQIHDLGPGCQPSWAPHDQQIAFQQRMGNDWQVWLMDSTGANRVLLSSRAYGPQWTADGQRVLVFDEATQRLSFLDLVTMLRQPCVPAGWIADAGFELSPRNQQIGFRMSGYRDEPAALVVCQIEGQTPGPKPQQAPSLAPQQPVARQPSVASQPQSPNTGPVVLWQGDLDSAVAWSPDRHAVLFSCRNGPDEAYQLTLIPVERGRPATKLPGQPVERDNVGAAWSNDGRHIAFVSLAREAG